MKRILVLMTVVALMMAMLAMSVAPAFAARYGGRYPDYNASYVAQCAYSQHYWGAQYCQ